MMPAMVQEGRKFPNGVRRRLLGRPIEGFRIHTGVFSIINSVALLAMILAPAVRPYWWVIAIWGGFLICHYMIARTINIDDEWVDQRTNDLRTTSYDLGHIRDIQEGYEEDGRWIDRTGKGPKTESPEAMTPKE